MKSQRRAVPGSTRPTRRGAVLYSSVLAASLMVAVLAMAALQVADVERRTGRTVSDAVAARQNARTALELALHDVWNDPSWRGRYQHNVESTPLAFGSGTVSWRLRDTTDSSLSDDPSDPVEVTGIGRVGNAAWAHRVVVQPVEREVGPIELRGYSDLGSATTGAVSASAWWGQYFRPHLPADATSWRVTGVDVYARQEGTVSGSTAVSLHLPQSNFQPGSTVVDQALLAESALGTSLGWRRIDFGGTTSLDPSVGLCLTLTATSDSPMRLGYVDGGVNAANSRLVDGTPSWQNTYSNKSLVYRVHGMYRVRELQFVEGSWNRVPLP